ncbi:MAG: thiamine-phosphate kinase [Alphaproteobacteria bacterium]|nr:thiamine-phosphate kinase [Alphaproteobacteria bacterium]
MAKDGIGDEFDLIARYFAPLAAGAPGALGLTDDAAIVDLAQGERLVAAADALVAGIHFLADDPPGDIAAKIVRVNLSDLAAMGARPVGMLMTAVFPRDVTADWLEAFAQGLKADIEAFASPLIGGDTVAGDGPLTLSLTALGAVPLDKVLTRSGAKAGDGIYVSGTVGDGALGLIAAGGGIAGLGAEARDYLIGRYRVPRPRLDLGIRLLDVGNAAIDVSDGLLADLGHICDCSGAGARIRVASIPLSAAARAAVSADSGLWPKILGGGDDYELLFTVPADRTGAVSDIAAALGLDLSRIGEVTAGEGIEVEDAQDFGLELLDPGYRHFR